MSKEVNISDINMLEKVRKLPLIQLREKADEGDALASLVLGEKILESKSEEERKKGTHLIIETLNSMEDDYVNGDITKELFVDALTEGIDVLLKSFNSNDGFVSQEAFKLSQNIYELDSTKTKWLGICYEKGVGCNPDTEKAMYYKEQAATSGGFLEKAEIFAGYANNDKKVNAIIWAQRALEDEYSDDYPKLKARIRLWLAENGETDSQGLYLDIKSAETDYNNASYPCTEDEAAILFELALDDNEKYTFAKTGESCYQDLKEYCAKQNAILQEKKIQEENIRKEAERKKALQVKTWSIRAIVAILAIASMALLLKYGTEIQPNSNQREDSKYKVGETYHTKEILMVRSEPIADDKLQIKRTDLKPKDYINSVEYPEENPEPASLKVGSPVVCLDIQENFMKIESGWIRTHEGDEVYVE